MVRKKHHYLRMRLLEKFETLRAAALALNISNTKLSGIIHGWIFPTDCEQKRIERSVGKVFNSKPGGKNES